MECGHLSSGYTVHIYILCSAVSVDDKKVNKKPTYRRITYVKWSPHEFLHLRFDNEVYFPSATAVNQSLHFLRSRIVYFIYKDIQYLLLTIHTLHNALSAFRPEEVIANSKRQMKFIQKMLKTLHCTFLQIRSAVENLLMWTNAS